MADVIARFKADTSGFTGGLKQVNRTFNELIDGISRTGRSIAQADKQEIEFVRSLGQMKTVSQSARGKLSELTGAFTDLKFRYNSLTEAEKKTPLGKELANSLDQLKGRIKETRTELESINKELNGGKGGMFSGLDFKSIASSAVGFTGVAGAAIMAVNTLKGAIEGNIRTAIDFEQANANLASVLGTTRSEITELTEDAKALGASTMFTASEVSNLQTELAKLGFTQKEIKNSTAAILDFSAATGAGLGEAAALAGASLRAFGLDAEEMTRVVSAMAVGTTKSALDFSYLQTAMSIVSPVAKQFGFEIEDVVTLLGTLANSGFDASSAATATRNILLYLADDSSKLSKALGGGVHSIEDFARGVKQLNIDGTQLAEMLDMTDKRAVAAFATFVSGADKILELRDGVTDCDEALRKMVDERMDTMEGSLKTLSSAWEGFNLTLNDNNGFLRDCVDALTDVVNGMTEATKGINSFINSIKDAWGKWVEFRTEFQKKLPKEFREIFDFPNNTSKGEWEGEAPTIAKPNEVNDIARSTPRPRSTVSSTDISTRGGGGVQTFIAEALNISAMQGLDRLAGISSAFQMPSVESIKREISVYQKMFNESTSQSEKLKLQAYIATDQSLLEALQAPEDWTIDENGVRIPVRLELPKDIKPLEFPATVAKDAAKSWGEAAKVISTAGQALQNIDNKGVNIAGIMAQAIANIILGFTSGMPQEGMKGGVGRWIAASVAGLATMTATIASVKSAMSNGYAEGGILGGQNYSGDVMPARVNAGEMIINQSDQRALYESIHSGNLGGGGTGSVMIRGEELYVPLRNYMRRTNKTL